jgi:hypothetical protein
VGMKTIQIGRKKIILVTDNVLICKTEFSKVVGYKGKVISFYVDKSSKELEIEFLSKKKIASLCALSCFPEV